VVVFDPDESAYNDVSEFNFQSAGELGGFQFGDWTLDETVQIK
jgi:hypothetical protein